MKRPASPYMPGRDQDEMVHNSVSSSGKWWNIRIWRNQVGPDVERRTEQREGILPHQPSPKSPESLAQPDHARRNRGCISNIQSVRRVRSFAALPRAAVCIFCFSGSAGDIGRRWRFRSCGAGCSTPLLSGGHLLVNGAAPSLPPYIGKGRHCLCRSSCANAPREHAGWISRVSDPKSSRLP